MSVEDSAREQGWVPQEEWEGEPEDWVAAKEFVFRGELMNRIKKQSSELRNVHGEVNHLKDAIKTLGEHNKKIGEVQYKKALANLRKEKASAIVNEDPEKVAEIEDEIDSLKELRSEAAKEETVQKETGRPEIPPEIVEWLGKPESNWYHRDPILRGSADAIGAEYVRANPESSPQDLIKFVEREIRKEFPHKFDRTKSTPTGVLDPDTTPGTRKGTKKFTIKDVDEDTQRIAKTYVDLGVFDNVQEYIDQLVKTGDLG